MLWDSKLGEIRKIHTHGTLHTYTQGKEVCGLTLRYYILQQKEFSKPGEEPLSVKARSLL